jgi:putative sporulation protein YyaC
MELAVRKNCFFSYTCPSQQISDYLVELIREHNYQRNRPVVFLCIGSDYYIGDALGPLIGSALSVHPEIEVWGTLEMPVYANNLDETIMLIRTRYKNPLLICIDAGIGKKEQVGYIEVRRGGLRAGSSIGHKFPLIGDISIIGIVNHGHYIGYSNLQNISLKMVLSMSKAITEAIEDVCKMPYIFKKI